jgi:hypothetical protein
MSSCIGVLFVVPSASGQDLTEKNVLQKLSSESPRARALAAEVDLARASALTEGLRPNGALSLSREAAGGVPETYLLYEQPLSITGRRDYVRRAALAAADSTGMSVRMQLHELRLMPGWLFSTCSFQEQISLRRGKGPFHEIVEVWRSGEGRRVLGLRLHPRGGDTSRSRPGVAVARMEGARGRLASFFNAS